MRQDRIDQRGQSLILLAVMGTFLAMLVALVIDGGLGFLTRRQVQNAADAASRAGANYLAQGSYTDAQISTLITSVATANNCSSSGTPPACTYTANYIDTSGNVVSTGTGAGTVGTLGSANPPSGAAGIKVTPQKTLTSFLAGVLGQNQSEVSATASAIYGSLGAASCGTMFPTSMNGNTTGGFANFNVGVCYLFGDDGGTNVGSSGTFGWVDIGGTGANAVTLRSWIDGLVANGSTGCNNTITAGTTTAGTDIDAATGNKATLQASIASLVTSAYSEVTVPLWDTVGSTSNSCAGTVTGTYPYGSPGTGANLCYNIRGFARFKITNVWLTGPDFNSAVPATDTPCARSTFGTSKGVLGQFVGFVDPNGTINTNITGGAALAKVVNVIS